MFFDSGTAAPKILHLICEFIYRTFHLKDLRDSGDHTLKMAACTHIRFPGNFPIELAMSIINSQGISLHDTALQFSRFNGPKVCPD
uniref:Uncharacterized protein n=1 Tax=Arundo donax TaxID=35708 RepID=A0A0A9CGQ4_ARUDO